MGDTRVDLRKELDSLRRDMGLVQKVSCTAKENKQYKKLLQQGGSLPENVHGWRYEGFDEESTSEFYTLYANELTPEEVYEYLSYKQIRILSTIKNCAVFLTSLTVIGLISFLILVLPHVRW